jgi:hypothetical protein
MKYILTVLICIFIFGCESKLKHTDEIVLHGTLAEDVHMSPDCGFKAWATVFKFKCERVFVGEYNKPFIYVAQNCPETLGPGFFVKDKKYKIAVNVKNNLKYDVEIRNKYKYDVSVLFWARNIENFAVE